MFAWWIACVAVGIAWSAIVFFVLTGIENKRRMMELERRRILIDARWNSAFAAYLSRPITKDNDDDAR